MPEAICAIIEQFKQTPVHYLCEAGLKEWYEAQPRKVIFNKGPNRRVDWDSLKIRFWDKILKGNGCWTWLGTRSKFGHGYTNVTRNLNIGAHVLSFVLSNGPLPRGISVLHKCDNPSCVRPDHLFYGTSKDNVHDCIKKGRNARMRLTIDQIEEVKSQYIKRKTPLDGFAKRYGVSISTIHKAIRGDTYFVR